MTDVTYVAFVPRSKCERLRQALAHEDTGLIRWSEKRGLLGSEFYFSGPAKLIRTTHAYIVKWAGSPQ